MCLSSFSDLVFQHEAQNGSAPLWPAELQLWQVHRVGSGQVPLIPGEQGQCIVMGMRSFVMCMEGASLPSQRQLLQALGLVVPFRWKPHGSNRIVKPVSCN